MRDLQAAGPGTHSKLIMALGKLLWQWKTKKPLISAGKPWQKSLDTESSWGNKYLTLLDWYVLVQICAKCSAWTEAAMVNTNKLSSLAVVLDILPLPTGNGEVVLVHLIQSGLSVGFVSLEASGVETKARFSMRLPCPGWLRRSQLTRFLCKTNV